MLSILAMFWQGSSNHVCSLRRVEFNLLGVNHILNLVFQGPTIIRIVPQDARMISTPCIWIVVRRGSLRVWMRVYHRDQIHLQHVLQCLWQWHVDSGEMPLRSFYPWLIVSLLSSRRPRYHYNPYCWTALGSILLLLVIDGIDFLFTCKWLPCSTRRGILLNFSTLDSSFHSFSSQYQLGETSWGATNQVIEERTRQRTKEHIHQLPARSLHFCA